MSWDEIKKDEVVCPCGKGKYLIALEMDDWNRMRTKTDIQCPACRKKNEKAINLIRAHEKAEAEFRKKAEVEAKKRFLPLFQAQFAGKAKKKIWEKLFSSSKYPALGTFYSHIRFAGSVEKYLEKYFLRELDTFFPFLFSDVLIERWLKQIHVEKQRAKKVAKDWAQYLPQDE
jgi:hypothetical protein